jgi:hypothetical protein
VNGGGKAGQIALLVIVVVQRNGTANLFMVFEVIASVVR